MAAVLPKLWALYCRASSQSHYVQLLGENDAGNRELLFLINYDEFAARLLQIMSMSLQHYCHLRFEVQMLWCLVCVCVCAVGKCACLNSLLWP